MEDEDGAVTAVLRGRVGGAVLERLECLMVAAGGGNVQVAPTHLACRGCGCNCITGYISSPLGIQGIEKGGGIPVTLNRDVRVPSSSLSTFSLDERQRRLLCDLGPIVFFCFLCVGYQKEFSERRAIVSVPLKLLRWIVKGLSWQGGCGVGVKWKCEKRMRGQHFCE